MFRSWWKNVVLLALVSIPTLALAQSTPAEQLLQSLNPSATVQTSASVTTPIVTTTTTATLSASAKAALIQSLVAEVKVLEAQIAAILAAQGQPSTPSTSSGQATFTATMTVGSTGPEVTELQQLLVQKGYLNTQPTGYYGSLTEAAVEELQAQNNIVSSGSPTSTGYGAVGPKTLALLNQLEGQPSTTPTTPTTPVTTIQTAGTPTTISNFSPTSGGGGGGGGSSSGGSSGSGGSGGGSSGGGGGGGSSTPPATPPVTPAPTLTFTANVPSVVSGSGATLTWSSANATSCTASGSWNGNENTSGSQLLSNLTLASTYTLACTGAGGSVSQSVTINVTALPPLPDTTPPSAPTSLSGSAISSSQINLSWTASTDNVAVTGYQVFRNGTQIASPTTNSYSNTGLTASTQYTYTVKATDAAGNVSTASNSINVTTQAAADITPPSVTITAPAANLTANTTSTSLSVTTNENATCRYSTNASFVFSSGTIFSTTGNTSHSTTLSGLQNSTSYTYYVKCQDPSGNTSGNASVTFSIATPADTTPPSTPTNLAATAVSSSQINLTWTASTDNVGVTGYQVFRGGAQIASPTTNSYSDTGLTASTQYSYTVKAKDAAGNVSTASAGASATTQAVVVSGGGNYVGFLDTYSSLGATWGFSSYKLSNAYGGNWGTVMRQSDSTTMPIGFDSSGKANVATFNSFCAGTNCYVTTLNDQVSGVNASQATMSKMPRVIVDSNGMLAVCPQPASTMTTPYSSAVNTPKVQLFAVAQLNYADNRSSQTTLPSFSIAGNVTKGSGTISGLANEIGISTANDGGVGQVPGVTDSAGLIPSASFLSALPSGSTASIGFEPGNISTTGSLNGDTIIFRNAVLPGAWIVDGPPSSTYYSSAYWAMGTGADSSPATFSAPRNGTIGYMSSLQNVIDQGMRGQWAVYDYDTNTTQLNYDGISLGTFGSAGTITYPTQTGMTLFSDTNGAENTSNSCFETMVLFPNTESSRTSMAQSLMSQDNISFPYASATSDGFTMTGEYLPSYTPASNGALGGYSVGPDAYGLTWNIQSGGYTWPSVAYANNITNGTTMWRFIVEQGDSDTNITGAERAEIAESTTQAKPGSSFSFFYQFDFEQLPQQNGDWCASGQIHYNNVTSGADSPDIVSFNCKGNQIQFVTQKTSGGSPVSTNCGAPITLTPGTTYAVAGTGFWSSNHTSDTLTINLGVNGSPLPLLCSLGPTALWDNDTGAYLKAGIYRGYPWSNAGTAIERVMNPQFTATANAFSSYIATQPALPSHTGGITPAPTCSISASPSSITSPQSSTLTWSSSNATSATLNSSSVSVNGSQSVSPTVTTAYTLNVSGAGGSSSCNTNVTVSAQQQDTTPPAVTITAPSGQLAANTTSTTLAVTTNENATCAWSNTQGVAFASMTPFTTTGGTSHSTSLTGLTNGSSYATYVECKDTSGNISSASIASYSVASSGGGGGGACSQATAFLARVSVDAAHQTAYSNLICGLVTDGVWNQLDILYVFATQSQATALVNLVNSTYSAALAGSPTFTANTGFSNGGGGKGIDLGWSPANGVNYTQYSASFGGWDLSNTAYWGGLIENDVASLYPVSLHNTAGSASGNDTEGYINAPVWDQIAVNPESNGVGWWSVDRNGNNSVSSNTQIYFDGSADGAAGSTMYDNWPSAQHMYASYDTGNTAPPAAAAYAGGYLTPTQEASLYGRLHTFLNAVNPSSFP